MNSFYGHCHKILKEKIDVDILKEFITILESDDKYAITTKIFNKYKTNKNIELNYVVVFYVDKLYSWYAEQKCIKLIIIKNLKDCIFN